ncbi:GNAT family N-acetyltransferase [Sporosarcina sp. ACRSL]|uniref:GNAT family N-acetyltransferase n=1 Tax=Sporosarcina sp. ACRSL TaxID=2918215 RepID=UPI001EF6671F|nr:GNAT family N-acetyltransferase [Sporosarcina sp. ACRSL]MCG7345674.1 GNAT family N-acetyltransferase [Sporosarcina sp. ACRSL]
MITYKEIDSSYFDQYDQIPMIVRVKSIYRLEKIECGLGGILFIESPVEEYIKDLGVYEKASQYADEFDITNWVFFMAFDNDIPIGAVTVASKTEGVQMLDGRDDMTVLWDIRIDDQYKQQGIGTKLFSMAVEWSRLNGFRQMKIECQNNNVPACKFYQKQGATLGKIDEYAYYNEAPVKDEVQLIWYVDL